MIIERIGSNSLVDLAARIQVEHQAVSVALKDSVRHAIAAGELLIEAKALLKHGQWLPYLREHCTMSERTAQLYMRCARHRDAIEANTQCIADLSLNEAAALLALSSDLKKLFAFARRAETMDQDELIAYAAANDIAVITNPFGVPAFSELDDPVKREWRVFQLFLLRKGLPSEYAERLQTRGWRVTLDCRDDEQWYGAWGDRYRQRHGLKAISQAAKDDWFAFYAANRGRSLADLEADIATANDGTDQKQRKR